MVQECDICKKKKKASESVKECVLLFLRIWPQISMDFIEGSLQFQWYDIIIVVVDELTKFGHFVTLKHLCTPTNVAKLFLDTVFKCHGLPDLTKTSYLLVSFGKNILNYLKFNFI
mgnify:CR=1 FL=1